MKELILVSLSIRTGEVQWENRDLYNYQYDVQEHKYTKVRYQYEYEKYKKEKYWQEYRSSLYTYMPHLWINKDDTSIELAHFIPETQKKKIKKESTLQSYLFDYLHDDQSSYDLSDPNSIVLHVRTGMYVFNIFNGGMCSWSPPIS